MSTKSLNDFETLETVRECVERLGEPPPDIAKTWREDAQRVASFDAGDFDAGDFDDWANAIWANLRIDSTGHLVVDQANVQSGKSEALKEGEKKQEKSEKEKDNEEENGQLSALEQKRARREKSQRWIQVALIAASILVVLGIISRFRDPGQNVVKQNDDSLETQPTVVVPEGDRDEPIDMVLDDAPLPTPVELSSNDSAPIQSFSLDQFMPPSLTGATDSETQTTSPVDAFDDGLMRSEALEQSNSVADSKDVDAQPMEADIAPGNILGGASEADLLADEEMDGLDETAEAQPTQSVPSEAPKRFSVELPGPPKTKSPEPPQSTVLATLPAKSASLRLEFPTEATIALRKAEDSQNRSWLIESTMEAAPEPIALGRLDLIPSNEDDLELQMRWAEEDATARLNPALMNQLHQGRIRSDLGDVIYLRPQLQAKPIRLDAKKRDVKLKWDLQAALPPTSPVSFNVNVTVSKEVETQWIEPLDPEAIRSGRAIAVMQLKKSKEVAMVLRLDWRTNRSFSFRLRYGARLDPSMPWQWTDGESVRQGFHHVTRQLELIDDQILRLDQAVTQAKRIGARRQLLVLEQQRDQAEAFVEQWAIIAKRLAQLDQLFAFAKAAGQLQIELSVLWPNDRQVVFSTPLADAEDEIE